jgi:hypothetical protein
MGKEFKMAWRLVLATLVIVLLAGCGPKATSEITLWNEIPIMAGAVKEEYKGNAYKYPAYFYTMDLERSAVEKFYNGKLVEYGWEILTIGEMRVNGIDNHNLVIAKEAHSATIDVFAKDGVTHVGVVFYNQ